jgi:hypothetical protein
MLCAIFLPQQHQRHAAALEFLMQPSPVRSRAIRRRLAGGREQPTLKLAIVEFLRQRPGDADHLGAAHELADRGLADPQCLADLPVAQSKRVPQPKHLAHLPHRQSLRWHRSPLLVVAGVPDQSFRSSTGMPFRPCLSAVRNRRIAVRLPSESVSALRRIPQTLGHTRDLGIQPGEDRTFPITACPPISATAGA